MSDLQPEQPLGMSRGALYTIGSVCGLFSVYMAYQASSGVMASPTGGYVFGGVLAVAAVGCFSKGRLQGGALRAMGGIVLLTCLGYLVGQLIEGEVASEAQSEPSVLNAIKALVVFGIPGAYLMIRGPAVFDLPGAVAGGDPLRAPAERDAP